MALHFILDSSKQYVSLQEALNPEDFDYAQQSRAAINRYNLQQEIASALDDTAKKIAQDKLNALNNPSWGQRIKGGLSRLTNKARYTSADKINTLKNIKNKVKDRLWKMLTPTGRQQVKSEKILENLSSYAVDQDLKKYIKDYVDKAETTEEYQSLLKTDENLREFRDNLGQQALRQYVTDNLSSKDQQEAKVARLLLLAKEGGEQAAAVAEEKKLEQSPIGYAGLKTNIEKQQTPAEQVQSAAPVAGERIAKQYPLQKTLTEEEQNKGMKLLMGS